LFVGVLGKTQLFRPQQNPKNPFPLLKPFGGGAGVTQGGGRALFIFRPQCPTGKGEKPPRGPKQNLFVWLPRQNVVSRKLVLAFSPCWGGRGLKPKNKAQSERGDFFLDNFWGRGSRGGPGFPLGPGPPGGHKRPPCPQPLDISFQFCPKLIFSVRKGGIFPKVQPKTVALWRATVRFCICKRGGPGKGQIFPRPQGLLQPFKKTHFLGGWRGPGPAPGAPPRAGFFSRFFKGRSFLFLGP